MAANRPLRIIPDRPGKGGTKTATSTHSPNLDTRTASNVFLYNGRWRKMLAPYFAGGVVSDGSAGAGSLSLYAYSKYSATNASTPVSTIILGHNKDAAFPVEDRLWNYTTGALLSRNGSAMFDSTNSAVPAKFLTVKNRCFICWGIKNGTYSTNLIFDGTKTYDVGCPAPTATLAYTIAPGYAGSVYATNLGNYVTEPTGTAWAGVAASLIAGQQVDIGGDLYALAGGTPYTHHLGAALDTFTNAGTVTATAGSPVVTINGAIWPAGGRNNGLRIVGPAGNIGIVGSYTVGGGNTTVQLQANATNVPAPASTYYLGGSQLQLSASYQGTTAWSQSITIYTNPMKWTDNGPQYAYARYNPTTGHVSNVSPILTVTEKNQQGVAITLTNIVRDGAASDIYAAGYTKLIVFRTLLNGGSVLYPIGDPTNAGPGLIDNTPAGATSFTDTYTDTTLLVGGEFQAPIFTNKQPPVFAHMEYWNGQIFGAPTSDPTGIYFSGDPSQIAFGVPEESYPTGNVLRIPAADGRVLGMNLVGNILVITTERYAYYVAGSASSNYRLLRFSTTMNGVADYQFSEFAGEADQNADKVLYVGNDQRFYVFSPGVGNKVLSFPVQDQFDSNVNPAVARIQQIVTKWFRWVVLLGSAGNLYAYDFEDDVWLNITPSVSPQCFAVSYTAGSGPAYYYANNGTVYQWLNSNAASRLQDAYIETDVFDATDAGDQNRKVLRSLDWLRIYVDEDIAGNPYVATITVDEKTRYNINFSAQPDAVRRAQTGAGPYNVDSPMATELLAFGASTGGRIVGHRFQVRITFPTATNKDCVLYALDIATSEVEAASKVEP